MKQSEARRLAEAHLGAGSSSHIEVTTVCRLWAGMGHIYRVSSCHHQQERGRRHNARSAIRSDDDDDDHSGPPCSTLIVKSIHLPSTAKSSHGDRRKAESYQVEANFYEFVAEQLLSMQVGMIPRPLVVERLGGSSILIGMTEMRGRCIRNSNAGDVRRVLRWLARFHAVYWGDDKVNAVVSSAGLQSRGSYWHLDTRPDEYADMSSKGLSGRVKMAARSIDRRLKEGWMQCLIHGDAKDANIFVDESSGEVCVCDFQYCGKGPPTKDLAYFFCSSVDDVLDDTALLRYYLEQLEEVVKGPLAPTLEQLRDSMDLAYCDFYRFMCGWGHWGSNGIEKRVQSVMDRLDGGTVFPSSEDYDLAICQLYSDI